MCPMLCRRSGPPAGALAVGGPIGILVLVAGMILALTGGCLSPSSASSPA